MENYYFFAVVFCLLPFVIGGIWRALHDTEPLPKVKSDMNCSSASMLTAEDCVLKSYYHFDVRRGTLLDKLSMVNLYDPANRPHNYMDDWFKDNTRLLMHDGKCLAHLNYYGHLEDTFWKNIKELNIHPERDKQFQLFLISVHKTSWDVYVKNFDNLLFNYGMQYKLLPEIESIIMNDVRFNSAKNTYLRARYFAEKDKTST